MYLENARFSCGEFENKKAVYGKNTERLSGKGFGQGTLDARETAWYGIFGR